MQSSTGLKDNDFDKATAQLKLDMNMVENQLQSVKKIITEDDKVSSLIKSSTLMAASAGNSLINDKMDSKSKNGKFDIEALKKKRIDEFSDMLQDIIDDISADSIRGSDAPIDTVMFIACIVIVLAFGAFVILSMGKGSGSALPIASKGRRED